MNLTTYNHHYVLSDACECALPPQLPDLGRSRIPNSLTSIEDMYQRLFNPDGHQYSRNTLLWVISSKKVIIKHSASVLSPRVGGGANRLTIC
jgi:hypothetical protein